MRNLLAEYPAWFDVYGAELDMETLVWARRAAHLHGAEQRAGGERERPMPRHIGIILDGNRGHARMRGLCDRCDVQARIGRNIRGANLIALRQRDAATSRSPLTY